MTSTITVYDTSPFVAGGYFVFFEPKRSWYVRMWEWFIGKDVRYRIVKIDSATTMTIACECRYFGL